MSGLRLIGGSHLNEHKIPDLQDVGVIHVHQVSSIAAPNPVIVDLGAGSTGALVAHFPEVVLCAERQNALCWQELQPARKQYWQCRWLYWQ